MKDTYIFPAVFDIAEDGEVIPEPTLFHQIELEKNQTIALIEAYMPPFREKQRTHFVKKILSIPAWLNDESEHLGINFSSVLREALEARLNT